MEIINYIILLLLVVVVILLLKKKKDPKTDDQSFIMIQNQLNEVTKTLDSKLGDSAKVLQEQFGQSNQIVQNISQQSNKMIAEITEKLTKLDDTNKQVVSFAEQLQSLENILKNPKQRGVLGEYYLETVLKNVLPPSSYKMQYQFKNGEAVDAVVYVKDKIIPIDSKFSLENYNRILEQGDEAEKVKLEKTFVNDLKQRIKETSKYIRPSEGTTDFAFMFIPHEAIYYDLLVNKVGALTEDDTNNILQKAAGEYKVIIVSPTSFLAYLQTVLQGLKSMQIEESAKEIVKNIGKLQKHIVAYEEYFKKIGNNLGTTVNMYNSAYREFGKIDKDVVKITGQETKIEPELIDKPNFQD